MIIKASRAFMTASVAPPGVPRHPLILEMRTMRRERFEGQSGLHAFTGLTSRSKWRRSLVFLLRCLAMSEPAFDIPAAAENGRPATIVAREARLQRDLTPVQPATRGLPSTIAPRLYPRSP